MTLPAREPFMAVEKLSAGFQTKTVLREVSMTLPSPGVMALMGPVGVGKSTLLRTLSRWNDPLPSFWSRGKVLLEGRDVLKGVPAEETHRRIPLLAQKARLYTATILDNVIDQVRGEHPLTFAKKRELAFLALMPFGLWRRFEAVLDEPVVSLSIGEQRLLSVGRLLAGDARCLLADEPLRDISEGEAEEMIELLRRVGKRRAVLLVAYNQQSARRLCDTVALMVEGSLVEIAPVERFFDDPQTELAKEFTALGNCWPRKTAEAVAESPPRPAEVTPPTGRLVTRPGGFHWVIMDRLGGMQRPGLLQDEAEDLAALHGLGCQVLVSLTQRPYDAEKLRRLGIEGIHFPIRDMGVPPASAALDLCRRIGAFLDAGRPTVLHCKAGLGRTGTLLACYLIFQGKSPVGAIDAVRSINPHYIQSVEQLAFIGSFSSVEATAVGSILEGVY